MSRPTSSESVFRAIGHPARRRILELLRNGERSVSELVGQEGQTRPNLSQHLQILRETGLVTFRRKSTSLMYKLNSSAIAPALDWVDRFRRTSKS